MSGGLLSWIVFTPAAGALLVAAVPREAPKALRRSALWVSLVPFFLALGAWMRFDAGSSEFQLVERTTWIERLGVSYFIGVDGISLLLVLLTVFLTPLVILSAPDTVHRRLKGYLVAMLALETTMLGTLVALSAARGLRPAVAASGAYTRLSSFSCSRWSEACRCWPPSCTWPSRPATAT